MIINFRQGIFKQPIAVGQPNFLQVVSPGVSFINVTAANPVIVDFAQGQSDYLFQETNSMPAWVLSVTPSTNTWLYWDISLLTGIRTFGHTNWMPVDSPIAPHQSTANGLVYLPLQIDQHWFDMVNFQMKVWNGSVWIVVIRAFAGSIRGGNLVQNSVGSQAGLTNLQVNAGYLLYDDDNRPIKKYAPFNLGEFITTTTPLASQFSKIQNYRLETAVQTAMAAGTIAQFKAVCYNGPDEIGQASCNTIPAGGLSYPAVGVATTAIFAGQVTDFVVAGFINDPLGTFNTANTFTPGKFVFVDAFGSLTTTPPTSGSLQRMGYVVDPTTIYLDIQPQITYGT